MNNNQQMTQIIITQPGGPEVLQCQTTNIPTPKADEVLVRVHAAGVNRPDVLQRKGLYPMPKGVTPVPGLEVSGVIEAIGSNVSGFTVGDRVCGLTNGGGYAEYCVVPVSQTLPIPAGLSFVQAAAIPETYFTVWANLFDIGQAKAGDTVLIHGGASGIGTTALSLCKALGIQTFATVGGSAKQQAISSLTPHAINYKEQDFEQVILKETQDKGVDVILDIVGASYLTKNMNVLATNGRLVIIGFMGGSVADHLDLTQLMLKRATITGSTMRSRNTQEKAVIADHLKQYVWPLLEAGQCLPLIHQIFPFKDVGLAHAMMERDQHIGKLVLTVNSD